MEMFDPVKPSTKVENGITTSIMVEKIPTEVAYEILLAGGHDLTSDELRKKIAAIVNGESFVTSYERLQAYFDSRRKDKPTPDFGHRK